jgi:hypothetical protein
LNSAKSTLGTFTPRNLNNKQNFNNQKPWFIHECRMARTNYRRSKRNLKFRRSRNLEENTKRLEKHYKKVLDTSIRTHRQKIRNKINNLKSTNPREYWKIINSGQLRYSFTAGKLHYNITCLASKTSVEIQQTLVLTQTFNHNGLLDCFIVAVSFIGGGNGGALRKSPTLRKSLTNFIT